MPENPTGFLADYGEYITKKTAFRIREKPAASSPLDRALFGFDNRSAFVRAAIRAYAMRQLRLLALRAHAQRRKNNLFLCGAPGIAARSRCFPFRYCHNQLLNNHAHAREFSYQRASNIILIA